MAEATAPAESTTLSLTRTIRAPREMVYRAWTDPNQLQHWFFPDDCVLTHAEFDVRVGGHYRCCFTALNGEAYWLGGEFQELSPPGRIVFTHRWEKSDYCPVTAEPPHTVVMVTLEDRGTETVLHFEQVGLSSIEQRDSHLEGWGAALLHLDQYVVRGQATPSDLAIIISRVIRASPEQVFKCWTDPQQLANWWGPNGFSTTTSEWDFRPGGTWRFIMHGPDGRDYHNRIVFTEITPPSRLMYDHRGENSAQDVQFASTVHFNRQANGTEVVLEMVFASREARDKVVREHGAIEGGKQHLQRLAEYVWHQA